MNYSLSRIYQFKPIHCFTLMSWDFIFYRTEIHVNCVEVILPDIDFDISMEMSLI